jgi:hypothetical protein
MCDGGVKSAFWRLWPDWKLSAVLVVPAMKVSAVNEVAEDACGQGNTNVPQNMGDTQNSGWHEASFIPRAHRRKVSRHGNPVPGICADFGKCIHQIVKTFGLLLGW